MNKNILSKYENKWVALTADRKQVLASDKNLKKLHEKVEKLKTKKKIVLTWVPSFDATLAPHAKF